MAGDAIVVDGVEYTPEEHKEMLEITDNLLDTREKDLSEVKEEKEPEQEVEKEEDVKKDTEEKKETEKETEKEVVADTEKKTEKEKEPEAKTEDEPKAAAEEKTPTATEVKTDATKKVEEIARSMGWRPENEFKNPDSTRTFKTAEEYIRFPYKENKRLKNDVTQIKETIVTQAKHQDALFESRFREEIDKLKEDKTEAIKSGDVEEVEAIDTKMEDLNKEAADKKVDSVPEANPLYVEWQDKNAWYGVDKKKTAYANAVIDDFEKTGGGEYEDLLDKIDTEMEIFIPKETKTEVKEETKAVEKPKEEEKVNEQKKIQPPIATVGSTVNETKTNTAKKFTYEDLSAEAKKTCDNFVDIIPEYTRQEYVDEMVEIGEVK